LDLCIEDKKPYKISEKMACFTEKNRTGCAFNLSMIKCTNIKDMDIIK